MNRSDVAYWPMLLKKSINERRKGQLFAAVHESPHGPFRRSPQRSSLVAIGARADVARARSKRRRRPIADMWRNRHNCNGTMIHVDAYLQYAFGCADEVVE